jgi:hypothetical protein
MKENRFKDIFKKASEAIEGRYAEELAELSKLSTSEIESITPLESTKDYMMLMEVVKRASRKNRSQAKLAADIKKLGNNAVSIASKIPKLAAILI